jgi:hypothetical protein
MMMFMSPKGHGLAAHALDLVHHGLGRVLALAAALGVDAQVVDDDARPHLREIERVLAAESVGAAGDDGDLSIQ